MSCCFCHLKTSKETNKALQDSGEFMSTSLSSVVRQRNWIFGTELPVDESVNV